METPLNFDRNQCYECPAQTQCDIGRFATKFIRKTMEPEVDMSRQFANTFLDNAYEAVYAGEIDQLERFKELISEELFNIFQRYNNQLSDGLNNLLYRVFNAQELSSNEIVISMDLDGARIEFIEAIDNKNDIWLERIPTLDELICMSKAAKEWRDANECAQLMAK